MEEKDENKGHEGCWCGGCMESDFYLGRTHTDDRKHELLSELQLVGRLGCSSQELV